MLGNDNCYDFWCGANGQATGLTELGLARDESQEATPDMLRRAAAANSSHRHGEKAETSLTSDAELQFHTIYLLPLCAMNTEPQIAKELLRLATSAVAEATDLGGGHLSVGAEADFVLLENISQQEDVKTESEALALDRRHFCPNKTMQPTRRVVFRRGRQLLFDEQCAGTDSKL